MSLSERSYLLSDYFFGWEFNLSEGQINKRSKFVLMNFIFFKGVSA